MPGSDVTATLQYLVHTGERPVYIASRGGADAALEISAKFEEREVVVHDARTLAPAASLDREGFTLREHRTGIADFYHPGFDRKRYENEIVDLVLAASGGSAARAFDHTLRSDSAAVRGQRTTREPAAVIHNDYTDDSARRRVVDLLGVKEAERRLGQRFAIVNVWRSIRGTVLNSPIACCDAATLSGEDLVPAERRAHDRIGEIELVSWNPAHRWYYYPGMTFDEALLIKTFDSRPNRGVSRSIHSAFANPAAPADAPPRESIESRLLVFFD